MSQVQCNIQHLLASLVTLCTCTCRVVPLLYGRSCTVINNFVINCYRKLFFSFHGMPRFRDWPKICWHPLIFKDHSTTLILITVWIRHFFSPIKHSKKFLEQSENPTLTVWFLKLLLQTQPTNYFPSFTCPPAESVTSVSVGASVFVPLTSRNCNKKFNGLHMYKDCYFIQISSKSEVIWLICTSFN